MNEVTVDTGEANAPIQAGITYNGSINTSGSIDLQTPIHISPDGLLYNPPPGSKVGRQLKIPLKGMATSTQYNLSGIGGGERSTHKAFGIKMFS